MPFQAPSKDDSRAHRNSLNSDSSFHLLDKSFKQILLIPKTESSSVHDGAGECRLVRSFECSVEQVYVQTTFSHSSPFSVRPTPGNPQASLVLDLKKHRSANRQIISFSYGDLDVITCKFKLLFVTYFSASLEDILVCCSS